MDRASRRHARRPFVLAWLCCALAAPAVVAADAQQALQQAAALVRQGRLEEAAAQARTALADPSARAAACSVLGAIRLQQRQLGESAKYLEQALELEPALPGASLNLAQVYALQGTPERALAVLRRAATLNPANEAVTGALQAFERSPDGVLALAAALPRTKDAAAASALARRWTAFEAPPVASSIRFATLLAEGGAVPDAITVLERARAAGPPPYELSFNLGSAYVRNGNPARALDAYDAAIASAADPLPALRQAAPIAEHAGELERSLSYWMRARKLAPEDPEILLGFGRVCLRMNLLDDAEKALEQAARLRPDSVPHQYTLAAAKVGKKQFEAAQHLIEPLVQARPDDPHLQYALGAILYIQGHLDDAAVHLDASARLLPDQVASYYYRALVARDQGQDADAIARLERFLQQHPDHAGALEALGGLLVSAGRLPEAEVALRKAVALAPDSVKANYQLGLLLARLGRNDESKRQLAHATTLREEDAKTSRLQLRLLDPDQ
jgi:tetratricopeptide (TPR) repeat protein